MAKGYPDFFGQSIFIRYGGVVSSGGPILCTGGAETTVFEVSGKGVLYNTTFHNTDVNANKFSGPRCYVDGLMISAESWAGLYNGGNDKLALAGFSIACYNLEEPRFVAKLMGPISFDVGLKITFNLPVAVDETVSGWFTYSLIS